MSLYQSFKENRYFSGLDGLRCLAIFGVLFHHSPLLVSFPSFLHRGYLGVDIFFALSGFLIVTLLLREKERKGRISLKNFYVRKALRILPVYYGILLLLVGLYSLRPDDPDAVVLFQRLPTYLTFLSNWVTTDAPNLGVIWALSTEVQFYLMWPLIEVFVRPPFKFAILGCFTAINIATSFGFLDPFWTQVYGAGFDRSLEILQTTFTPICFGILLAHLLHSRRTFDAIAPFFANRWTSTALFSLMAVCVIFSPNSISLGGPFRLMVHIVIILLLASLLIREDTPAHKVLNQKIFVQIGLFSYGIYLYHMFVYHVVRSLVPKPALGDFGYFLGVLVLGSLLSVVLAAISFYAYEKPILSFKKKLSPAS
ncbi:MAG: acyltransferase [Cyanobacteria bacterium J06621_11]